MPTGPDTRVSRRALLALFLVFSIVWFSALEYRKLIKPDEGRYAEIAREMAISGDWITPRLNGIKYFEKPPLQYWATAAAFKLFGEDEWTARLWSGLTGFAGVLLVFFTGRHLFGTTAGLMAAAFLGSNLYYVALGHLNTLDMGVTFFLTLALCGFLRMRHAFPDAGRGQRWMTLAWVSMACAVLSKGLIGLLFPGLTLIAYSFIKRDWKPWRQMNSVFGIPVLLLVAAPWFVAVSLASPEFPRFFFIHEHFERFLTSGHRREQPWWYFGAILLAGLLPWTGLVLHALARNWRTAAEGFDSRLFLALWAAIVFAFFSLSESKLPSYILPMFPALALLAGDFAGRIERRPLRAHYLVVAAIAAAGLILIPQLSRHAGADTANHMIAAYARWLATAAGVLLAASALALWLIHRGLVQKSLLAFAAGGFLCCVLALQGHQSFARSNSAYYIAREVAPLLGEEVPFYSVRMYEQTLPFYLRRTLTLVDYTDEMGFGLQQQPHLAIPTLAQFEAQWKVDGDAFAVMSPQTYSMLKAQGLPMQLVTEDARRSIVRKPQS